MLCEETKGRNNDEDKTLFRTQLNTKLTAYLDYNGRPNEDDDPADYYVYPKGVRLA